MVLNNSLNDSIIRIKNGQKSRKKIISLLKSNIVIEILTILQREGYIKGFKVNDKNIRDKIFSTYKDTNSAIVFYEYDNIAKSKFQGLELFLDYLISNLSQNF